MVKLIQILFTFLTIELLLCHGNHSEEEVNRLLGEKIITYGSVIRLQNIMTTY